MDPETRLRQIRTAFETSDVTRRDYLRAAAGVGALALPGTAVSQTPSAPSVELTEQYRFVYEHTPDDETVPTLIEFESADALDQLSALDVEARTTDQPKPVAYADLSPEQVGAILSREDPPLPGATAMRYSPGANPFWRVDAYDDGVFPDPADSSGFIAYEEAMNGLSYLEERHPDRLSVSGVGSSAGWYNVMDLEVAPQQITVATVTNDVTDEASFREKEKVLYSLSIHGDERSGAEAGSRLIEDVLRGKNGELESLLDELVLVFLYPNPDGWVAKSPVYFSGDEATETDLVRVDAFRRYNGTLQDLNRQWPTVGYIDPTHYPADPDGSDLHDDAPGIDEDVPVRYEKYVPGALDIVEHLRGYENLNYGADLHGMFDSEQFVLGLLMNTEYEYEELHQLYELNRLLERNLTEAIGPLIEDYRDVFERWATDMEEWYAEFGDDDFEATVPTEAFSYGTIYDTIQYTTTGTFGSWFAQPEELGGLNLVAMSPEMALDNRVGENMTYYPEVVETQVVAYQTFIETMATQATRTVTASVDTADADTAYVTTDALRRSSETLSFAGTAADSTDETVTVPPGETRSLTVSTDEGTRLHVGLSGRGGALASATLIDPRGDVVESYDPSGTRGPRGTVWTRRVDEGGEWTIRISNETGRKAARVGVSIGTVTPEGDGAPDPKEALGYRQREYEVTPFAFFEEYAAYTDTSNALSPTSIEAVANGELLDASGSPAVDNLVVIHDRGADCEGYVAALRKYVAAGGNLVLTDTGVRLLAPMGGAASAIGSDDIREETFVVPFLGEKNADHPLMGGVRDIQKELWKVAPLGYPIGDDAPMTLLRPSAFGAAGGTVAATTGFEADGESVDWVAAGTIGGGDGGSIQVVASLLRPATQEHLHPFGLHDYSLSFLGQTVFSNALGYRQERFLDGELVRAFEPGESDSDPDDDGDDSGAL